LKVRFLIAVATLALAGGAPPIILDSLPALNGGGQAPLVEVQTWVQHINALTS
jgi:hypothetical protein